MLFSEGCTFTICEIVGLSGKQTSMSYRMEKEERIDNIMSVLRWIEDVLFPSSGVCLRWSDRGEARRS